VDWWEAQKIEEVSSDPLRVITILMRRSGRDLKADRSKEVVPPLPPMSPKAALKAQKSSNGKKTATSQLSS
jgi:hypothetical protein